MLIIAIPKSASTSLLHTLGEIHDIKSQQDFENVKENAIPEKFRLLGKYHSDCRTLISKNVKKWNSTEHFYKQHIPPTKNNLQLLHHSRKVILLRNPEEIILAYRRAENKELHKTRAEFEGCVTEEDWIVKAKEIGLFDELNRFYIGWTEASTEKHLIHFDDLVSNEKEVLRAVSEYFNLPITDVPFNSLNLKKIRYSRHNVIREYAYKVVRRLKNIFTVS